MSYRIGSARFFGPGGSGPQTTIQEVASFFAFEDDFDRPDSGTVGNGWVEELEGGVGGSSEILSNLLRQDNGAAGTAVFTHRPNGLTDARIFVQATERHSSTTVPSILGLFNTDAFAGRDGYQVRADTFAGTALLERMTAGAVVAVDSVAFASIVNTFYVWQFASTDDPTQEVNVWRASAPASIQTLSGADATHAALAKRVSVQLAGTSPATADWNNVIVCLGAADPFHVTCANMRVGLGDKIKLLDAGMSVVASAQEAGAGIATIDLFNLAAGVSVPIGGFPTIQLTDSADVVLSTLSGSGLADGGVYPGATFTTV